MKLDFNEALERLNDQRSIDSVDVLSSALRRTVWLAEWHIPGCMSESQSICLTKSDAIAAACFMAENDNGIPHGMKTNLRKYGRFDCKTDLYGTVINTVSEHTLGDLL